MKKIFSFLFLMIFSSSIFALSNKVVSGQILPITVSSYSSFESASAGLEGEAKTLFQTNEEDVALKVYEVSERKGDVNVISYVIM